MSNIHHAPFKVAVAQATPVFLDRVATLEKACELIVDAGLAGARLIVFPAAFIPGYPAWVWTTPATQLSSLNELYVHWLANAVSIPSDTTDRLCRVAQRARVNVVIGLNECEGSGGTCYNTLLYIDAQGQIMGKHRSLVLVGAERMVWTQGDGSTLQVHRLPIGTIGGLIGGEHYLPLARYALYAWGTQIYIADAWDYGETWLSTLRHIAKEGHVFVLGCSATLCAEDIPESYPFKQFSPAETWLHAGSSVIVNPNGEIIAGPVREKEAILYGEIDLRLVYEPGWMLNTAGYDARADIFQLTVHREPQQILRTNEAPSPHEQDAIAQEIGQLPGI
ncbi:MAG: carbon-nitrogen hydrolase family protein [Ktedonobacteraceae bacterium]